MRATYTLPLLFAACANTGTTTPSKDDVRNMGKADDGHDWCGELGWYGDGMCDDFCLKRDPDCATDQRTPELKDPKDILASKLAMSDGLAQAAMTGPVIEAKFEPDDSGKLSLSIYPVKSLALDSERNVFQELSGDPTAAPWATSLETFHDYEHLTRSSRDLTLRQLSAFGIEDIVREVAEDGAKVYWAIPTIQEGRAGYGIWALYNDEVGAYVFVDGGGSHRHQTLALGTGPDAGATDARTPELNGDPTIVRSSAISMSAALAQVGKTAPAIIEAKFEIGDDGKLSLSIYTTDHGLDTDGEHQSFFELAGDPTAAAFAPTSSKFDVPDEEHVTRSARDLTLVQTSTMSIMDAVQKAEAQVSRGIVYWAIPTIRGTSSGWGVYVLAPDNTTHYFFIS